jgi:hypothetical protein
LYPRLVNNTSIKFTDREAALLNTGPKYNLHTKTADWLTTLALEAETAINQLPPADQEFYRKQVADRIKTLHNHEHQTHNKHTNLESHAAKSIQSKLNRNNATIAIANKSSSLVILPTEQYKSKVQNLINENKFRKTNTDPTKAFQSQIQKTLKQSKFLIPSNSTWKYTNLNPSAPTIKGLIKYTNLTYLYAQS